MVAVMESAPPRFRSVPLHVSSAGQDAVDLAGFAGLALDQWQAAVLIDAMSRRASDRWSALEVCLIVPRQNGKNRIIAARQLFGLFADKRCKLQTHTAHRADTCFEQHKYLVELLDPEATEDPDIASNRAELWALVKDNGRGVGDRPSGIKESNGKESIELRDGSRIIFRSRVKGSGRGLTGDVVYFDEAYYLTDMGSLIPSLSARTDPQVWYTSSAPRPIPESDVLRGLARRGRGSTEPGLFAYIEYSVPDDVDIEDPASLPLANPSVGMPWGGVNAEYVYNVERGVLGDEFELERFGRFSDQDDSPQWLVVPEADWKGTERHIDGPGWIKAPRFAVEVEPDDAGAAIVAAGVVKGGEAVELIDRRPGVDWLTDRMVQLVSDHAPGQPVFVDEGSAADLFAERFEAAGLTVHRVKTKEVATAAAEIVRGISEGSVLHRSDDDQQPLTDAVGRLEKRTYADVWLPDRRTGPVVLPFLAASLALWGSRQEDDDRPPEIW